MLPYVQPVKVPTLMVAGYFDAEDFYGPLELYHKYESEDPKHLVRLVMGPWYHGSWSRSPDGRSIGKIDFGQDTSRWFRDHVQAPWFAYWLKGRGSLDLPPVLAFRTGENRWERYDSWPPLPVDRAGAVPACRRRAVLRRLPSGRRMPDARMMTTRRIPRSPSRTIPAPSPMTTGRSGKSPINASSMDGPMCSPTKASR